MNTERTCGELYLDLLGRFTDMDPEKIRLFAPGFVCGQCEKVFSGACQAAMFRPSLEYRYMVLRAVHVSCDVYGLLWDTLGPLGAGEIWVRRLEGLVETRWQELCAMLADGRENTPGWHQLRAAMCGIPADRVDLAYHERKGSGKRCD